MSITAVTQLKPTDPEIGDVLFGKEFIVEWIPSEFPAHIVDRVCLIPDGYHPRGLKEIACDFDLSSVQYDCPWSKNIYYWMYPICLLPHISRKNGLSEWSATRNVKIPELQVRKISRTGHFLDCFDPHRAMFDKLISAHMGHGYTAFTRPSDGHGRREVALIDLSTGDEALVAVWVWFNK